ncbi:sensor histidine kinase [Paenibacillus agricola]|uniref:Sensor histidine kinase n=1 Tax=Paenibacillus agricola TaxID=2716264 RepID=A0ABX0J5L8_9BACL|nr:sensor histidine kinase [Paenibacillus agricola]NHN31412.1 sensor histidine kinase [Paenibacillus agricola]
MKRFISKTLQSLLQLVHAIVAARYWLIVYVLLILLPAGFFLYTYYQRSSSILEQEVTRSMLQTVKQAGINLQFQMDRVRDTSNSIFLNPYLYKYLTDSDSVYPIDVVKDLRSLIDAAQTNENVFRIRLFVDESKLYAGEKINFFPLKSIQSRSWYPAVMDAGGAMVWTGAYKETYIDRVAEEVLVLSSVRLLREPKYFDRLAGILVIDMKEQTIRDIMSQIELSEQRVLYIVNKEDMLVWHSNPALIGKPLAAVDQLPSLATSQEGIMKLGSGKDAKYAMYTPIRNTDWRLVAEVPAAEISLQANAQNQFSWFAVLLGGSILFLLLVFVLLAFIIRGMNRRVQLVIRTINREGLERLDDHMEAGNFNLLERGVDHMIHKVKGLIEETYTAKVQEREAQLRALQAQINPHFLYNTLDTINWIAVGRGAHDISQMIDALAKYFRLSLNKGRDLVSIEDELNLAKVYLEIQQNRFPHSFTFTIEADPAIYPFFMPKLTLQPIVENALLHGIRKSKAKSGSIRIEARREADELVISITDDGSGMDEEAAGKLLTEPQTATRPDSTDSSYGLNNVNERIRLFSGAPYGLSIRSKPDEGMTVTVRLKAQANLIPIR